MAERLALQLKEALHVTTDADGYTTGKAVFYGSYLDAIGGVYTTLKVGKAYSSITSGLSDTYGLVITGIEVKELGMTISGEWLAEITVTAGNKEEEATQGSYSFTASIQSAIMEEKYRGNTKWDTLGMALPDYDKTMKIPYAILKLSGTYWKAFDVSTINSLMNTVNAADWDLSAYGLGTIYAGNAKFVGYEYTQNIESTAAAPVCTAGFTFHLRAYNWNLKVRSAEVMKDIDGKELFWQGQYSWLPTYNAAKAGLPIWVGETGSPFGGNAALASNDFDTELFPKTVNGQLVWAPEFPAATWSFL